MTEVGIRLEHEALDKIHRALRVHRHRRGMKIREIADRTGLAIGFVQDILRNSGGPTGTTLRRNFVQGSKEDDPKSSRKFPLAIADRLAFNHSERPQ